jgi:hypothetical protein
MRNVDKELIVQAIIEKYEKEYDKVNIQTELLQGYEKPGKIFLRGNQSEGYIPDVVLEGPDRIDLFEVEMGDHYQPEKWRLFSLFSNKQKGSFNIVTPEEQLPQLRDFLDMNKINAKLLYFS